MYVHRTRKIWSLALAAGLVWGAAACGSSTKSATSTTTSSGADATPVAPVAGCGPESWTDPDDMSADRTPARCETNTPAARPLAEPTEVTISVNPLTAEFAAPFLVGLDKGEFAAENITLNIEQIPVNDAMPMLVGGEVDGVWSGPTPGFFNLVGSGNDLKWVLGNFFPSPQSKTGLWANRTCSSFKGAEPSLEDISGKLVGSLAGPTSPSFYPIGEAVTGAGGKVEDLQVQVIPSGADIVNALKDCAVDAAWVLDPFWLDLDTNEDMVFLQGQRAGEPAGGLIVGPSILDNPEVGQAVARALIRTINTYFPGDYHADAEFMQYLAGLLNRPVDQLTATPALVFDWELRTDTATRMQGYFIAGGTQQGAVLPETQTVDRSFYEAAVGHAN